MLSTARARLSSLSLSEIFANPDQPRKNFDADRLEELAMSIRAYGVQEPIKVVPISQDAAEKFPEGARYMIVMGERRYRASLLAGIDKIPAIIQSLTPDEVEELALLENLQREDLNVMEEAMAFQSLLDKGNTVETLALKLGYKQPWRITERTSLLTLSAAMQDMVLKGHIGNSEAFEMSRVTEHEEQMIVFRKIKDGTLNTYEKLRAFVSGLLDKDIQDNLFELPVLNEEEQDAKTSFERTMERVTRLLKAAFKENELVVLRKVLAGNRDENIERIELMIRDLNKIRKALVQDKVATEAARELKGVAA